MTTKADTNKRLMTSLLRAPSVTDSDSIDSRLTAGGAAVSGKAVPVWMENMGCSVTAMHAVLDGTRRGWAVDPIPTTQKDSARTGCFIPKHQIYTWSSSIATRTDAGVAAVGQSA
jgi:hypothetical protein